MNARAICILAACVALGALGAALVQARPWASDGARDHRCLQAAAAGDRVECWSRELLSVASERGDTAALDHAEALLERHDLFRSDCHTALHPVGERAGRRAEPGAFPQRGGESIPACRQGYLHGFLLGRADAGGVDVETELGECAARPVDDLGDCAHALGHLFLRTDRGDVARSLDTCTAFDAPARREQFDQCGWGVFMEQALRTDVTDAQHVPCEDVDEGWRRLCWRFEPSRLTWTGVRWNEIAEVCNGLDAPRDRRECAHGIGISAPRTSICSELRDDLREACRVSLRTPDRFSGEPAATARGT